MAVALAALDAGVRVMGPDGSERTIPLNEFYRLPGETPDIEHELRRGEIIVGIDLPPCHIARQRYRKVRDRAKPEHVYSITWFDVFRIDEQGLIAEHWDPSEMWVDGKPPGAEFFDEIFK